MTTYAMYLEENGCSMSDILETHFKKYGQPPQPVEMLVNKEVDTESIQLPVGMTFVIKAQRCIMPLHVWVGLEEVKSE